MILTQGKLRGRKNIYYLQKIFNSIQGDSWKGQTETCLWAPCLGPSTQGCGGMEVFMIAQHCESMNKIHLVQKHPQLCFLSNAELSFNLGFQINPA